MIYIFDLDGVLCDDRHRQHHLTGDKPDWEAYYAGMDKDAPVIHMCCLLADAAHCDKAILLTGRPEKYRETTYTWLRGMGIAALRNTSCLIMRPDNDHRPAPEFKLEAVREIIPKPENPHIIFDDTCAVVTTLREAGYFAIWVPRPGWPQEEI